MPSLYRSGCSGIGQLELRHGTNYEPERMAA